jgi:hypothetical protein
MAYYKSLKFSRYKTITITPASISQTVISGVSREMLLRQIETVNDFLLFSQNTLTSADTS